MYEYKLLYYPPKQKKNVYEFPGIFNFYENVCTVVKFTRLTIFQGFVAFDVRIVRFRSINSVA